MGNKWTEEMLPVQHMAMAMASACVPPKYVRPHSERPLLKHLSSREIPAVDLSDLHHLHSREKVKRSISEACGTWGVFHVVNHGVPSALIRAARDVSREFFMLPLDEKLVYANDTLSYVGYGTCFGSNNESLDWGDYFFHHIFPESLREEHKWPSKPHQYREVMKKLGEAAMKVSEQLMELISESLGLQSDDMQKEIGGEVATCVRLNYYPQCQEPDLTLGLSAHTDPGAITLLLQDENVEGLHVRHLGEWVAISPLPDAFTVILGDQVEIMTNGEYKSVEHRAAVNDKSPRMSIALFCNPQGQKCVGPLENLLEKRRASPKYQRMRFDEYRKLIRRGGAKGKIYIKQSILHEIDVTEETTSS